MPNVIERNADKKIDHQKSALNKKRYVMLANALSLS